MKYIKINGRAHKFIGKEIKQLMKVRDRRLNLFVSQRIQKIGTVINNLEKLSKYL
jgi:hypothetical protein